MALEIDRLYHMDCLDGMKLIPDQSIDFILCDLPYQQTKNHWDVLIPFEPLWAHYKRILKPNGVIALFGNGMFTAHVMYSNPSWWRYNLIWEKNRPTGFLNAKRMPLRSHEDICIFYSKQPTYNPQFWEGIPLHGMGTRYKEKLSGNNNYNAFNSSKNPSAGRAGDTKKYPRSVLKFDRPHPPIHPTQKSLDLCKWLIETYTNEGMLVLDHCAGSGTTLKACQLTNRHFIGFELDADCFQMACREIGQ